MEHKKTALKLENRRINFLLTKALVIASEQLKRIDSHQQKNDAIDMQIILNTQFRNFHYSGNVLKKIAKTYKTKRNNLKK